MHFRHAEAIWDDFPQLVAGVLLADGITSDADVRSSVGRFLTIARGRLESSSEAELDEIRAWRAAFSKMGLKPTQYRSASEALLRRLRKEGSLPEIHPLIDLCNAISAAYAVPVAAFDVAQVAEHLEVRYADGTETYLAFSGEVEHPDENEVVFADGAARAHARRWTNRQSAYSAVRRETRSVLIVAEALHGSARDDVQSLLEEFAGELRSAWSPEPSSMILSRDWPRFDF
jgi:DNA/RNA-binding domain of Phe-tRNA-synthetase-like protein